MQQQQQLEGWAREVRSRSSTPPPFCETSDPTSQHRPFELLLPVIVPSDLEMQAKLGLPELAASSSSQVLLAAGRTNFQGRLIFLSLSSLPLPLPQGQ